MATATTLPEAAFQAYSNLYTLYLANTLKTQVAAFCAAILPTFPDETPDGRPVANWATLLYVTSSQMPSSSVPYTSLNDAATQLYKLCFMAQALKDAGLITASQASAVLTQYNAKF